MNYVLNFRYNKRTNKVKYGIIVTTHNRCKLLQNCLHYIKNQEYTNYECVIVNDCSTDNTQQFCEKFCNEHNKFHLITNKHNLGVSASRNIGMQSLSDDCTHVVFCDDDDYMTKDKLLVCTNYIQKYDYNIYWHAIYTINNHKKSIVTRAGSDKIFNVTDNKIYSSKKYDIGHVHDKVYNLKFLRDNEIYFNEKITCYEDTLFNLHAYLVAEKMYYINKPLYVYKYYKNSLVHTGRTIDEIFELFDFINEECSNLSKINTYKYVKNQIEKHLVKLRVYEFDKIKSYCKKTRDNVTFNKPTIICKLYGRLGTLLFQVATAYCLAKKYNYDLKINNTENKYVERYHKYDKWFDDLISPYLIDENYNYDFVISDQKLARLINLKNIDKIFNEYDVIKLENNFQSEIYFDKKTTCELFKIPNHINEYIHNKYGDLSDYVAISVRRGDYLTACWSRVFANPTHKWFERVYEQYFKGKKIMLSSDDIDWCKENLTFVNNPDITYCDDDPETTMFVLSQCGAGFIGSNSTFSWWCAYLGENNDKKIIFPDKWWNPKSGHVEVLVPERWTRVALNDDYEKNTYD